jgi:Na+-transporting NADH:ubiquinone oxidoreductase subunit NqrF
VAAAYRVRVAPGGEEFEVAPGERLLTAARRAGVWLPFECGWGSCGTCKVTVVEGETSSLFAQAPAVHPRDARRARILACQSTAVSDLVLKPAWTHASPRPHLATADYEAELVEVAELAPAIREFIAKQYAGGRGSECLSRLRLGTVLPVELPYGDMWLRQDDRPVFLIAGGTGVSAILALAQRLSARADSRPVRAFYGAASEAELVCRQQLGSLVDRLPDGQFHTATVEASTDRAILTGFVTDALAAHAEGLHEAQVYLAGPPPMVDAVLSRLRELALSVENIHYDRFG